MIAYYGNDYLQATARADHRQETDIELEGIGVQKGGSLSLC